MKDSIYRFNLFFLLASFIWPLFRAEYLESIDSYGRVSIALMFIAIAVNAKNFSRCPKVMYAWLAWIVFSMINSAVTGFHVEKNGFMQWMLLHLVQPYVVMFVGYLTCLKDWPRTLKVLFYGVLFYMIVGSLNLSAHESYDMSTRLHNVLGNQFFNSSVFLAFFALFLNRTNLIGKKIFAFAMLLSVYVIMISGERKALLALLIILFFSYLGKSLKKGIKGVLLLIVLLIGFYMGIGYVMENTVVGLRMSNSWESSEFSDNLFLQMMGDRAIMYVDGWDIFLDNVWTGIGLRNYANKYNANELTLHTEYMVQLCECGIAGSALFLTFYIGMIQRCWTLIQLKLEGNFGYVIASTLLAIISINFTAWSYDVIMFFLVFGVILASYDKYAIKD